MTASHPRTALFDPGEPAAIPLPVCDHYCGVEARMQKSLELQAELGPGLRRHARRRGRCPGRRRGRACAPDRDAAGQPGQPLRPRRRARVAGRAPALRRSCVQIVLQAARRPAYLMLPKPRGVADVERAARPSMPLGAAAVPDARADRDPRRPAGGQRAGRAPAHRVAVLRLDGLRLGAPRRDPDPRHDASRASSNTRWWCAPSSRSPPPAMPLARRRRTASSPSSSTPRR